MGSETGFFLAADRNYFPYACLAARRILDMSDGSVPGFILQTGVARNEVDAARPLLADKVEIVDLADYPDVVRQLAGLTVNSQQLGLATYIRLFADRIREFERHERLVYVDTDVLFNRSIADLAQTELREPVLAAHDEQHYFDPSFRAALSLRPGAPYFNAGVMLLDMAVVRREGLLEQARRFAEAHGELCLLHDQDALNVVFEGRWQTMDPRWNAMTNFNSQIPFGETFARHLSRGKPWYREPLGVEPEVLAIYRGLAAGTPWADHFTARPLAAGYRYLNKRMLRKSDVLLGLLPGKERLRRRARYDARRALSVFSEHAERGMKAVEFPEKWIGIA